MTASHDIAGERRAPWAAAMAIVRMELTLRLRDPAFLVLLAFLLAGCALLVPDPSAGYAVVTFDHKKPIMSADTALIAAGIVLGALFLPVYSLTLDVGHARDRRTRLDRLQLTSPVGRSVLSGARLIASFLFMLLTTALSLVVISSTIVARYGDLPGPSAITLFLLIAVPVGMTAALLAAVLDRFLPERNVAKTAVAFSVWIAAVTLPLVAGKDLFAIGYLQQAAMPDDPAPAFAVGVIAARDLPPMLWQTAPFLAPFAWSRLALAALMLAVAAGLALLLRPGLSVAPSGSAVSPTVAAEPRSVQPARPRAVAPATASTLATVRTMVGGWMSRSRFTWAAVAIALLLALLPGGAPGAAVAVALTLPMMILSKTSVGEVRVAATLEKTTAALFRPSPALMHSWVLALLAIAPTLPGLARMPQVQAATAVLGVLAAALWLTWTHRCVRRPLLGVATFATFWYFDVFNDLPPALDLLGLWQANAAALLITASVACGMLYLVARHDRRGGAGTRAVA